MTQEPDGAWYYQQIDLGYNYRMTDIQAALGSSQMRRLDEFVARRHVLARRYDALLASLPVTIPYQLPETYSGLHLYVVRLHLDRISHSHRDVFDALRAAGIGVNLHYIPVNSQPYYRKLGFTGLECPQASTYYAEAISLPMYSSLSFEDQDRVVAALSGALR